MATIKVNHSTGNDASTDSSVTPLRTLDYAMKVAGPTDTVEIEGTSATDPYKGSFTTYGSGTTVTSSGGFSFIAPNKNYSHGEPTPDPMESLGEMQAWVTPNELYAPPTSNPILQLAGSGAKRATDSDVGDGTIPSGRTYCTELENVSSTSALYTSFTASPEETIKIRLRYQTSGNSVRARWSLTDGSGNQWVAVLDGTGSGSWVPGAGTSNHVGRDTECYLVGGGLPQVVANTWEHVEFTIPLNANDYDSKRYIFSIESQASGHSIWIDDLEVFFENRTTNNWENFSGNVWRLPNVRGRYFSGSIRSVAQLLKCSKSDWDINGLEALKYVQKATDNPIVSGWGEDTFNPTDTPDLGNCVNTPNSWFWARNVSTVTSQASDGGTGTRCTKNSHGLFEGQRIHLTHTTDYNGIYSVSNVTATTFDIDVPYVSSQGGAYSSLPDLYYHLAEGELISNLHLEVGSGESAVKVEHSGIEINNIAAYGGDINFYILADCTINNWRSRHGGTYGVKIFRCSPTLNDGSQKYSWFGDNINCEGDDVSPTSCAPTINRCFLSYAGDDGIQATHGARPTANNVIISHTSRVKQSGDGFNVEENTAAVGSGMTINHCVATNCGYDGIKAANTTDGGNLYPHGPIIINNTISYNNNKNPISSTAVDLNIQTISQLTESHNMFGYPGVSVGPTSIVGEDPLFVYRASDFRLLSNSPAIGAGVATSLTTDIESTPFAAVPNIGAYAYFVDESVYGWVPKDDTPLKATKDKGTELMDRLLLNQYGNSTNLHEYLSAYVSEMDTLFEQIEEVYIGRFIEYAVGTQLDIIGIILNENRNVPLPIEFFGFNDDGIPSDTENVDNLADQATPLDGGVFKAQGQLGSSNFALSDPAYRKLLLAKAYLSTRAVCTSEVAYQAISRLIGHVPGIFKLDIVGPRQIHLELASNDTSETDAAIVTYFGKYLVPLGTTFNVTRI